MKELLPAPVKTLTPAILLLVFFFANISPVYAAQDWANTAGCAVNEVATIKGFECLFSNFISVILAFAGIVLFIMLVTGGFRYLVSGGDPKAVEAAKGTLTQAIVGLVILVLAFLILKLIETITGVPITQFRVTQ